MPGSKHPKSIASLPSDLGPKMRRLDQRERRFAWAMLEYPTATQAKWAEIAGYGGEKATPRSLRVQGHQVARRQRILDAVAEETPKRLALAGLIGIMGLMKIASDPTAKGHLQACIALADRGGYVPTQEINVKHEHTDMTGREIITRIRDLAQKHGLDPVKLLGGNRAEPPEVA
jgi:hypothetical protein